MRHLAWVVAVAWLAGCGGRYKASEPPRSRAEQYAMNGASSVPAASTPYRPTSATLTDAELQALAEEESSGEGETIMITGSAGVIDRTTTSIASVAGSLVAGDAPPPPSPAELAARQGVSAVAQSATPAPQALPEQLVVEGWFGIEVDDVRATVAAIREQVVAAGGRVVTENLNGSGDSWAGELEIRLPPAKAHGFAEWLDGKGEIRSRRLLGTDVSRTLFDQQIELENNELTLRRLQKLLERETLEMKDVLAIENELTRVRGRIDQLKGEQRFLQDRVALATIHVSLSRPAGVVLGEATTKLYPGPRLATLVLLTPDGRERVRYGGGVVVGLGLPRITAELDVFAEPEDAGDGDGAAVIATVGGAFYSDHFGHGRRPFLNPYVGLRAGYGYLDASSFVVGGDVGVELFKSRYLLVDANVRVVGLFGSDSDAAAIGGLSMMFAF
jgi:hypothetical protein